MFRITLPSCLLLAAMTVAQAAEPKEALALQEQLQNAIQDAEPAIACILVSRSQDYFRVGETRPPTDSGKLGDYTGGDEKLDLGNAANVPESYGSGVVIDESGLILTNYHVIRGATKVFVRLPGAKGSYADIHAADPRSDLAVLRLLRPPAGLKAIKIGDGGKARKGQMVLTIANPFAAGFRDGSPSASWGIISNIRRRAPDPVVPESEDKKKSERDFEINRRKTLHHYGILLQTDARLNLGCSGGALIDLKGELIGLTTAFASLTGTETAGGFAVPLDAAMKRIIEVLKRGEEVEYGFLGVTPHQHPGKVVLSDVMGWSPAFRAGLRGGDVLLTVNGMPVQEIDDVLLATGVALAGSEVQVEVRRGPQTLTKTVTLAKFRIPAELGSIIASRKPSAARGLRVDYTSVLYAQTVAFWPREVYPTGVVVREVLPDSGAAKAMLRVNDVVTHVNGKPVGTPAEFYKLAGAATGPLELTLHPNRPVKIN
jgi:S1-C subfamily serine protease